MGSRKPSGKIERLPMDYEQPRRRHAGENGGDFGAALTLTPLTAEERAARAGRAMAVLRAYDAEDLAEALGLVEVPEHARPVPVYAAAVPCPACRAPAGQPCIAARTGNTFNGGHKARYEAARRHQEAAA